MQSSLFPNLLNIPLSQCLTPKDFPHVDIVFCYHNDITFHYRTTAYGFLSAASRIAGVLGSLCFGQFIYSSQAIPMLTTSAVLMIGAMFSLKLKETRDNLV